MNYFNFNNLKLYTLILGNIIKKGCNEQNDFIYYFYNTSISSKILENVSLNISIRINEDQLNSQCKIKENEIKFNMECKIESYCSSDNYNIIYENEIEDFYKYDNYITIYINNSFITTTTLKAGYIIKDSCEGSTFL